MSMHSAVGALCAAALAAVSMAPVLAQPWPGKPIRLIVAQAPGSATDMVARIIAPAMAETLGQPLIVDNRTGAGGVLGSELVAKAPADGYTLLLANISTHGVNPALHRKLPFDPVRDFTPVSMVSTTPNLLVVHPSLPARTVRQLVALARSKPGALNFATPGTGSSQHLATELFRSMAGFDSLHVPYKGTPPAMAATLSGEASWMMPTLTSALPHVKANRVRVLAVTSAQRLEELPDVPALAELFPGFEVVSWYALVGPAGVPRAIVDRLNQEVARATTVAEVRRSLAATGMTVRTGTPEQLAAYIRDDIARWTRVVREAKIAIE